MGTLTKTPGVLSFALRISCNQRCRQFFLSMEECRESKMVRNYWSNQKVVVRHRPDVWRYQLPFLHWQDCHHFLDYPSTTKPQLTHNGRMRANLLSLASKPDLNLKKNFANANLWSWLGTSQVERICMIFVREIWIFPSDFAYFRKLYILLMCACDCAEKSKENKEKRKCETDSNRFWPYLQWKRLEI